MVVSPADCMTVLQADGFGTDFSFTFRIFKRSDMTSTVSVSSLSIDGTVKTYVEGVDYDVQWHIQGGVIHFLSAPPANSYVIMQSAVPYEQYYQFQSGQIPDGYTLTNALDELDMKIIQLKCELGTTVKIDRDPKTGVIPVVTVAGALTSNKILETDNNGRIISSTFSAQDLQNLGTAVQNALKNSQNAQALAQQSSQAAQQANNNAQSAMQNAQTAMQNAQNSQTIATQAKTDAANSATQAATSAQMLQQMQTILGSLATSATLPAEGDLLVGTAQNTWTKTPSKTVVESLIKLILQNDELLGKFSDKLQGIPVSGLGSGGGGGGGGSLTTAFINAKAGEAAVGDPTAPLKYRFAQVPVGDASKALLVPQYNAQGGFTAVPFPTANNAITIIPGTGNPGMTVHPDITLAPNRPGGCFPLVVCYDPITKQLTIKEGNAMAGDTNIPAPTAAGQFLTTTTASNGGIVYGWKNPIIPTPNVPADVGKTYVMSDHGFVMESVLQDNALTKEFIGMSGIIGTIPLGTTSLMASDGTFPTSVPLQSFIAVWHDATTGQTTEKVMPATTITLPSTLPSNDCVFWVYLNPTTWQIEYTATRPDSTVESSNILLYECFKAGSTINAVKPIYDSIGNWRDALRDVGHLLNIVFVGSFILGGSGFQLRDVADFNLRSSGLYVFPRITDLQIQSGPMRVNGTRFISIKLPFRMFYVDDGRYMPVAASSINTLFSYYHPQTGRATIPTGKWTIHYVYLNVYAAYINTTASSDYKMGEPVLDTVFVRPSGILYNSMQEAEQAFGTDAQAFSLPLSMQSGMVLVCKVIANHDTVLSTPSTFKFFNVRDVNQAGDITNVANLPSPIGVADGTLLSVKGGAYVLDPSIKAASYNPADVHRGDVLVVDHGKVVGKDPATLVPHMPFIAGSNKSLKLVAEQDAWNTFIAAGIGTVFTPTSVNSLFFRGITKITRLVDKQHGYIPGLMFSGFEVSYSTTINERNIVGLRVSSFNTSTTQDPMQTITICAFNVPSTNLISYYIPSFYNQYPIIEIIYR